MSILDDPKSIIGIGEIMVDTDDEFDIDDLEKSIIKGSSYSKAKSTQDITKEYKEELDKLSNYFGIESKPKSISSHTSSVSPPKSSFDTNYSLKDDNDEDDDEDLNTFGNSSFGQSTNNTQQNTSSNYSSSNYNLPSSSNYNSSNYNTSNYNASNYNSSPYESGNYRTVEEMRQADIKKVLSGIDKNEDTVAFINEEDEEDEMAKLIEHIDHLRTNLKAEGVDLDRIPEITANSNRKEARSVLKVLQIKNDRLRYCDIFEEVILSGAFMLESTFDGKKVWFGNQIDLTGWPDSVKVKLRRMRYDTSSFIGEVVKGYNIGAGWRILFELLPSLFLYSRDRRIRSNDNLASDAKYKNAINELNSK